MTSILIRDFQKERRQSVLLNTNVNVFQGRVGEITGGLPLEQSAAPWKPSLHVHTFGPVQSP